jgi:hypothetical protein
MKNFASTTGGRVALSAAAISVICALFIPYGYPWPSLVWALVAGAAAVSVVKGAIRPSPSMNDVISGVEAEPARAASGPGGPAV